MKEIVIRGTARPIHFGMRAINEFTKNTQGNFETNITTTEAIATMDSVGGGGGGSGGGRPERGRTPVQTNGTIHR